ncbi:MAG: hypothetical protein IKI42_05420 [Clostridia bacterium]|nr:hypothetical protein [Clostridia bacterium]
MKKNIVTLLLLFVCVLVGLTSCSHLQVSEHAKQHGLTIEKTFEECLEYTTDILLAKCKNKGKSYGYTEYSFEIQKKYFSVYEGQCNSIIRVLDYYNLYDGMVIGQQYVLLLERRPRVLRSEDTYLAVPITINTDKLEKSTVQGQLISQKTNLEMEKIKGFQGLLEYMSDYIKNNNKTYCRDYIRSNDLKDIAEETDYLARVQILKISEKTYKNESDSNLYECYIEEDYKNKLIPGEVVLIWLPDSKVEVGKTYNLAFMVYSEASNYLELSAKRNFFSDAEIQEMEKWTDIEKY